MSRTDLPIVSIVTPSYNMAGFVERTIDSVLSQDYPNIEYIVVDGGSTDGTVEVLRRYQPRLKFTSGADRGAADAINSGFRQCHGAIFAWLNADDTYLPGAVSAAVERLLAGPELGGIYGDAYWTDSESRILGQYPTRDFQENLLRQECFICQPACFVRSDVFRGAGMLNAELQFAFDYDFWIRASARHRFQRLPQPLATSRMHRGNKTLGQRGLVFRESLDILRHHFGYVPFRWIHSYCSYLLDRRDQFYEPLTPTFFKYLVSLPVGCWHNRGQIGSYAHEWLAVMSASALVRLTRMRYAAAIRCLSLK